MIVSLHSETVSSIRIYFVSFCEEDFIRSILASFTTCMEDPLSYIAQSDVRKSLQFYWIGCLCFNINLLIFCCNTRFVEVLLSYPRCLQLDRFTITLKHLELLKCSHVYNPTNLGGQITNPLKFLQCRYTTKSTSFPLFSYMTIFMLWIAFQVGLETGASYIFKTVGKAVRY